MHHQLRRRRMKGLPPSLVNYAIDIVVFLVRYIDDDEIDDYGDDASVLMLVYILIPILVLMFMSVCIP
jgi:hypothetical protein